MLEPREAPVPVAAAGQVLVRLRAAGLNRGEFIAAHGLHAKSGAPKPAGAEGAGEIVAVGAGVAHLKVGERVMGRCAGAFAEYALMDARRGHCSAARPVLGRGRGGAAHVFMIVHDMLIAQGRLAAGEWLLVTGVSSGVGVAALQDRESARARG